MSTGNSQVKGIRTVFVFYQLSYLIILYLLPAKIPAKIPAKKSYNVWILSMFFSPYKATEYSIDCRCFISKKLAQEAMRREARRMYKYSDIIQEASNKYYREYETVIDFGESEDGPDYRREFGFCEIKPAKLEDEESGDDVPSSTDDEDESDDEY